jgi:hypothetical protein
VQSNAALGLLNMVSTTECPAALLSSDRLGLKQTLPAFARLQREHDTARTGGDPRQLNAKEPKLAGGKSKPTLPTAMTAGKTREYMQLAVSRLRWLVDEAKVGATHAAILKHLEDSGRAATWGVGSATTLLLVPKQAHVF